MWTRLHELGQGGDRLVQTRAGEPLGPPPPQSGVNGFTTQEVGVDANGSTTQELELTDTGRAVHAGDADRAALVPLDRWVGGIHVTGPDPAWRWDRATQRAVSANGGGRPGRR